MFKGSPAHLIHLSVENGNIAVNGHGHYLTTQPFFWQGVFYYFLGFFDRSNYAAHPPAVPGFLPIASIG